MEKEQMRKEKNGMDVGSCKIVLGGMTTCL